jgi:hypothetical protein
MGWPSTCSGSESADPREAGTQTPTGTIPTGADAGALIPGRSADPCDAGAPIPGPSANLLPYPIDADRSSIWEE